MLGQMLIYISVSVVIGVLVFCVISLFVYGHDTKKQYKKEMKGIEEKYKKYKF